MIYDSLRKLPKVIQIDIYKSGDVSLLSDENTPLYELEIIWEELKEEFEAKYGTNSNDKVFRIAKEIDYLENKYIEIIMSVEALEFEINEQLMENLQAYGYKISIDNYNEDLKRIERESKGILNKIELFKEQLPKTDTKTKETSIITVMGSYATILGLNFDFYKCSVEEFHEAYEVAVDEKIKMLEKQSEKTKK